MNNTVIIDMIVMCDRTTLALRQHMCQRVLSCMHVSVAPLSKLLLGMANTEWIDYTTLEWITLRQEYITRSICNTHSIIIVRHCLGGFYMIQKTSGLNRTLTNYFRSQQQCPTVLYKNNCLATNQPQANKIYQVFYGAYKVFYEVL